MAKEENSLYDAFIGYGVCEYNHKIIDNIIKLFPKVDFEKVLIRNDDEEKSIDYDEVCIYDMLDTIEDESLCETIEVFPVEEFVFLGKSYENMPDDMTHGDFKKSIQKELKKLGFTKKECTAMCAVN